MGRTDERERIAAELTHSKPNENCLHATRLYGDWCAANGRILFPDPEVAEQQLLRFLHANVEVYGWAWSTCNMYALGVAQSFTRAAHPDPRGQRVQAWLLARQREQAGRPAVARPDALAGDQIVSTAEASSEPAVEAQVARLRGIVAVADALGVDPTSYDVALQRLPRHAFLIREEGIVITDARGERHVLDQGLRPEMFTALELALDVSDAEMPLLDASQPAKTFKKQDTVWLRRAWDLAAPRNLPRVVTSAATWRSAFDASTPLDRVWWLKCVDRDFEERLQSVAYLLVGVQTAFRHATMRRLVLGQMQTTPSGFLVEVASRQHKGGLQSHAQGGEARTLMKRIDHLAPDSRECPVFCPACALSKHLDVRRRRGGSDTDPVWCNRFGAQMDLGGANRRLKTVLTPLQAGGHDRAQTIGTRSLRVSAATLARRSGMPLLEIAEEVTDHAKLSTLGLYLRQVDPFSVELTLPILA